MQRSDVAGVAETRLFDRERSAPLGVLLPSKRIDRCAFFLVKLLANLVALNAPCALVGSLVPVDSRFNCSVWFVSCDTRLRRMRRPRPIDFSISCSDLRLIYGPSNELTDEYLTSSL